MCVVCGHAMNFNFYIFVVFERLELIVIITGDGIASVRQVCAIRFSLSTLDAKVVPRVRNNLSDGLLVANTINGFANHQIHHFT